ncbi:1970_t:CDS:2, partial [Gigaspora margarita]
RDDSIYGDLDTRIKAYGYSYSSCAQNVGVGYKVMAVEGWMRSQGHQANMLNPRYAHLLLDYPEAFGLRFFRSEF